MAPLIKATVRYDGTPFSGWQVQPNQRTVQGAIEDALGTIAGHRVRIHGAGRTDAGVHALAQVFHCEWDGAKTLDDLRRSLSRMLAPHIRIEAIEIAPENFHARYSAMSKRYGYAFISESEPDPFSRAYAWRPPSAVEPERVAELAQALVGRHDFAGYCSSGTEVQDTVRTLFSISLHPGCIVGPANNDRHWHLEFHGTGFLYKMVRNITGTIVDVARGATPEARIAELLASKGPYLGNTAPAHGLFLMGIEYETSISRDARAAHLSSHRSDCVQHARQSE